MGAWFWDFGERFFRKKLFIKKRNCFPSTPSFAINEYALPSYRELTALADKESRTGVRITPEECEGDYITTKDGVKHPMNVEEEQTIDYIFFKDFTLEEKAGDSYRSGGKSGKNGKSNKARRNEAVEKKGAANGVIKILSVDRIGVEKVGPSPHMYASDHMGLVAEFQIGVQEMKDEEEYLIL